MISEPTTALAASNSTPVEVGTAIGGVAGAAGDAVRIGAHVMGTKKNDGPAIAGSSWFSEGRRRRAGPRAAPRGGGVLAGPRREPGSPGEPDMTGQLGEGNPWSDRPTD